MLIPHTRFRKFENENVSSVAHKECQKLMKTIPLKTMEEIKSFDNELRNNKTITETFVSISII